MDCIVSGLRYGLTGLSTIAIFLIGMIVLIPILNGIATLASKFTNDDSDDDIMSEK